MPEKSSKPKAGWLPLAKAVFRFGMADEADEEDAAAISSSENGAREATAMPIAKMQAVLKEHSGAVRVEIDPAQCTFVFQFFRSGAIWGGPPWELLEDIHGARPSRDPRADAEALFNKEGLVRASDEEAEQGLREHDAVRRATGLVWRQYMLHEFNRAVAANEIALFARVGSAIAPYEALPFDVWPLLTILDWQNAIARDPEGLLVYSVHVQQTRVTVSTARDENAAIRALAVELAHNPDLKRADADGKRLSPCKASTIRTRRTDLISLAKKAVRIGTPIESITSLSALIDPCLVEKVIDDEWEKAGPEPKGTTIDLGKKVVAVARSIGLDEGILEELAEIRAKLEKHRVEGMTPKNMKLIRQVLNGEVWERVVNYPTLLMKRARSLKDRAPVKAAVMAEVAVAIAILTLAPVRAANLAAIRLDENLIRPGGLQSPYLLVFPHYDVKNRVDLTFEFDDYLTELIDEYVQEYRPSLLRGANGDWLFPGTTGGSKNPHLFGIQITERIQKATGLRIHHPPVPPRRRCYLPEVPPR